jgi:ubiquitin carboxyl-terminal hydrolase 4/11/15
VFLPGEFQGIFNLSYFSGKELVPVGWNSVNEDTTYTPLSARDPRLREVAEEEEDSVDGKSEKLKASDDISDEDEDDIPSSAVTRMNDEDSDEDPIQASTALPDRTQRSGAGIGPGTTRKKMITYSRRKRTSRLGGFDGTDERELDADIDDGPLVRLGEGIVVDWNPEAHAELFDGQDGDSDRGVPTYTQIELMDDPILEAKRNSQASRKRNGISLQECLDEYAKEEILSENDTWKCPRCEKMRRASKKLEIWKTPDILIMHLKRFRVNGMRREKIDVNVDFPIENFDLSSRVLDTPDGKQEIFDLFAVDNHYGSLGGGHYTAFAKSFIDGQWYEYNGMFS